MNSDRFNFEGHFQLEPTSSIPPLKLNLAALAPTMDFLSHIHAGCMITAFVKPQMAQGHTR